jgi:low temperature requirement protein LtrA
MRTESIVTPGDQGATFVELFFDLVFVFAVTQITHYAAHHLDGSGILRSAVLFWLIWWGWAQFTWALNSANTDHQGVRAGTLLATGVAFVMAVSLGNGFSADQSEVLPFALSYVAVRVLGLGLFLRVVFHDRAQRSAVLLYAMLAAVGLLAVILGAFLEPSPRLVLWSGVVALDLGAAWLSGRRPAGIQPRHFAERHGLIVIIALGESVIVTASSLSAQAGWSVDVVGAVALVITGLLWWTHFGWVKEVLEEKLIELDGDERARLARDVYTLWHLPLVGGIVALAVGFEASLHPDDYTTTQAAAAMAVGLTFFLVSCAAALWRAHGCVLWNRLIILALTLGGLAWSAQASARQVLAVAAAGLAAIVAVEQVTTRRHLVAPRQEARRTHGVDEDRA